MTLGGVHATFAEALRLHQAGRLADAEKLYRQVLLADPRHADSLHLLGLIAYQVGRSDAAVELITRAIELNDNEANYYCSLGVVLKGQGKLDGAVASYDRALAIRPEMAEVHVNRGNVLHQQGKFDEAMASYAKALALRPDYAEAHRNRGAALEQQGKLDEAVASYERALAIRPDFVEALNNLAWTMMKQGRLRPALNIINQSLRANETAEAKGLFVVCVKRLRGLADDREIRATTLRALTEPWGQPGDLAAHAIDLIKGAPNVARLLARAAEAGPNRLSAKELFGASAFVTLATDPLLVALLESATVCDIEMECLLTLARSAMLEISMEASSSLDGTLLRFCTALARQCFINEYVFFSTEEEEQRARTLRASLIAAVEGGAEIPVLWLIAVASHFPLLSLPQAHRLMEREWPPEVAALLVQQIREPMEEVGLRSAIPRLTGVGGAVSLGVQKQYEENPYPRWTKIAPLAKATNLLAHLSKMFPLAPIERHLTRGGTEILIAGCGTGQHSIGSALLLPDARVLAIDLSMSSLCYAARKTRELGLSAIEYAQADLLKLDSLDRRFDVIETVGVLHHLEDPWAGWRTLLSVLRPGGFMKLGFYSAIARQDIVRMRKLIAEQNFGTTATEIRRGRQHLIALSQGALPSLALMSQDFYSTSGCRDLLFHVQEHHVTLTDIESFIQENGLTFLGFELNDELHMAYRSRFSNDAAGTNLGQWQIFEKENPSTFIGMYQFWVEKTAAASIRSKRSASPA